MKYRKKPIVIEAEQWFPGDEVKGVVHVWDYDDPRTKVWGVATLEGFMEIGPGDYVITGIEGEKYPCKMHIFEATYEAVEE